MKERIKRIAATIFVVALAFMAASLLNDCIAPDRLEVISTRIHGICTGILVVAVIIGVWAMDRAHDKFHEDVDVAKQDEEIREYRERMEKDYESEKRKILRFLNWGTAYFWFIYLTLFVGITSMFLYGGESGFSYRLSLAYIVWIYGLTGPACLNIEEDGYGTRMKEKEYPYLYKIVKEVFEECGVKGRIRLYMEHQNTIGVARTRGINHVMLGAKAIGLLDEQELRQALIHEAAHIKNKDSHMSFRLCKGYEKWRHFSGTRWGIVGISPVYILCYLYSKKHVLFMNTSSHTIEVMAEKYASNFGNRQEAINGLAKITLFDCYMDEYLGDGRYYVYQKEKIEKGMYWEVIEGFKDMLPEKEMIWRERMENYLLEDVSSHPTFTERKEIMGIEQYQVRFQENDSSYEAERKRMVDAAEQELCDILIDDYDEMREEYYLAPMARIAAYKAGELGDDIYTKIEIASVYDELLIYDGAYELYQEIMQMDPKNATAAYGIGRIKLMKKDNSGIQDIYDSLENHNDTDEKLETIGDYCVKMGLREEYERWKQFKNDKLDYYYNVYDRMSDYWEEETLSASDLDQELIKLRKRQILEIGQDLIAAIYLVKKQLNEVGRMDAFLLRPKENVVGEQWEEMIQRVFLLLDNTTDDDVSYGLYCLWEAPELEPMVEKIEGTLIYYNE